MGRRFTFAAGVAASIVVLAGCGSSSDSGSTNASTSGGGGASSSVKQEANDRIAAATKVPTFNGPTEPVDMASLKGKRVMILSGNNGVPFVAATAKGGADAAKAAGLDVVNYDGKGQPSGWSKGIQQAVTQGLAGVFTVGVPPEVVKTALADAKKNNVPVVNVFDLASPEAPLEPEGLTGSVTVDYAKDGSLMGDYIVANSDSDSPHVLVIGDASFPSVAAIQKGTVDQIKKLAPNAKIVEKNVPVSKLATGLPATVQTELRKDPDIKWVVSDYDAEAIYIVPAIKQAGKANDVKVVGHDAVPQNLKWVQAGDVQVFDVGDPATWGGWGGIDALARGMLGMEQQQQNIPTAAFTKESLAGKDPESEDDLFGTEYKDGYLKLWGLQ
jgi:ABC-type sugar transport system substrate-binding protein